MLIRQGLKTAGGVWSGARVIPFCLSATVMAATVISAVQGRPFPSSSVSGPASSQSLRAAGSGDDEATGQHSCRGVAASGAHMRLGNTADKILRLRGGMLIYKDAVSGDEMLSDSFPIELVDDVVLKVTTKMVNKDAVNVNIGANPSAEGGGEDEGADDQAVKVNDVVDAFNLQCMGSMDKKGVLAWVKGYLKAIKERLEKDDPDRVPVFTEKSQKWVKEVLLKVYDSFEFYTGPSFNTEGTLAMMIYEGENVFPYIYYFKDGLASEKA